MTGMQNVKTPVCENYLFAGTLQLPNYISNRLARRNHTISHDSIGFVSRLRLQLAAAAIFGLAWMQSTRLDPKHESGILPIDPPTPYTRYTGLDSQRGRVLVIHGLDVSKNTTHLISAAIAEVGFEVYAIDLPGHGDSPVKFRTGLAQQAISNARIFLGEETIVLGH